MTLIDTNSLPRAPWKNGGGETCTLGISPESAGFDDFDWRVSIAEVREAGPFSSFAGVDRIILLLSGQGMVLESQSGMSHALTVPFEPWALRGEEAVFARLVNGATRDLNVMVRRGRMRADVQVWRGSETVPGGEMVLFCAAGRYRVDGHLLTEGLALRISPGDDFEIATDAPGSVLIGARFHAIG